LLRSQNEKLRAKTRPFGAQSSGPLHESNGVLDVPGVRVHHQPLLITRRTIVVAAVPSIVRAWRLSHQPRRRLLPDRTARLAAV